MTSQSFSPPHPEIENHPLTPKVVEDETLGPRPENHPPKPEGSFLRLFSMLPMTPPTHTNVNVDYYSKPVLPPLHTYGEGWNASSGETLQTASPMPKPQKPDLRKELLLQSIEQPSRSSSVATTFVDWSPSPTPPPNARRVAPREKNKTSSLYSTPASSASASETPASETPEPPAKRKFSRGKTLTISDKLVLIRLCCENKGDYSQGNKHRFWKSIRDIFKQETGVDYASIRQTVERWVQTESEALEVEEMESGTRHDKDMFREGVEEFLQTLNDVKAEQENKKKTIHEKLAEAQNVARVQQTLLAGMDDDDEVYDAAQSSSKSTSLSYKKRRKTEHSQLDVAAVVVDGMEKSMTTLGSSLKEAMAGANVNDNRLKKLETDNEILKDRTNAILEMLVEMRNKM